MVRAGSNTLSRPEVNVDGARRDEDTFILGDEEDSDVELDDKEQTDEKNTLEPISPPWPDVIYNDDVPSPDSKADTKVAEPPTPSPSKYYIVSTDTLQGIALRFGLDVCSSNSVAKPTLTVTLGSCNMPP